MLIEKEKEKNIVEQTKDKTDSYYTLIPNESFGGFIFGDDVRNYFNWEHIAYSLETSDDAYHFPQLNIDIWLADDGSYSIQYISTEKKLILNHINWIGKPIKEFNNQFGKADSISIEYLYNQKGRRKHVVYDYDLLGLQLWTFRGRIVQGISGDATDMTR